MGDYYYVEVDDNDDYNDNDHDNYNDDDYDDNDDNYDIIN